MSLQLLKSAAEIESNPDIHLARLLILLGASGGKTNKPVQGIMKLAKLDFLLRYPNCLERALAAVGKANEKTDILPYERTSIEASMIRFKYGPWDKRYRNWIGLLVAKGLVKTFVEGKTVMVSLTAKGDEVSKLLSTKTEFISLSNRSKLISANFGKMPATKIKDFIYEVFPEIADMKWGEDIKL